MTKQMMTDYIKQLRKKVTILIVLVVILSILLAGSIVWALLEYETVTYEEETVEIDMDAESEFGDVNQTNDMSKVGVDINIFLICGTGLLMILILCATILGGIYLYGKSKNKNSYNEKKNEDC